MNRNDPTVMRLATEAGCDPRTVISALEGRPVRHLAMMRIERAAKKLRIALPKRTT